MNLCIKVEFFELLFKSICNHDISRSFGWCPEVKCIRTYVCLPPSQKQTWSESVNYKLNHSLSELNWNLEIKQTADRLMPFWYWLGYSSEQNRSGYHDIFLFKSWSGKNIWQWMIKSRNWPGLTGSLCSKMWPASKISIFDAWDF